MDENDAPIDENSVNNELRTPSPTIYLSEMIRKEKKEHCEKEIEYIPMEDDVEQWSARVNKRERDDKDEDEGWQTVMKEKKIKTQDTEMEMYISCKEKFPKQFALAKLLKELKITDITKIKYLSPYKIRVEFDNVNCMNRMMTCEDLLNKGWKFQKAFQVNFTYGTIKDVDLDLTEEEIKMRIKCDSRAELSSVCRWKRRDADGNWIDCERVRLCFKGSYLPTHVFVDSLRINVDSYTFPVSQCSRCWKLGHTLSRCPSDKIICPKCGGNHANCETKTFVCVNCQGPHMALNKGCPVFLNEKKIREIMSQFNCTYRKARTMLPESPNHKYKIQTVNTTVDQTYIHPNRTYANIVSHVFPPTQVDSEEEQNVNHISSAQVSSEQTKIPIE
ncbi:uncharacterized protein LOC125071585 [Vanessa atalanta]|uniref:uncharacterized protein LOC125071585 n=1 Tax=Vanessa atalanta TaxID=42275 RepID=UPI001FCCD394|nr:uncharacterized protein LOC125071585 [Vanessa atalanta]